MSLTFQENNYVSSARQRPGTTRKTGDGTFGTLAQTRPKREAARGGRSAEKLDAPSAAAQPRQGAHGELVTARAPAMDAGSAPSAGSVSAVDARGGRRGRETRRRSCGARPEARPRRGRAAGTHGRPSRGASRALAALAAPTGTKRWLCTRAVARSRTEVPRRGFRWPTAASTRKLRPERGRCLHLGANRWARFQAPQRCVRRAEWRRCGVLDFRRGL